MKIIHLVLGKANPDRLNGVNKVVNSLATYQKNHNEDVTLWGITSRLEMNFPERPYNTVLFRSLKNKLTISKKLIKAIKKLDKQTVVHIHGGFIPEFYHVVRLLVKHGIAYVYTPHGAFNVKAMQKSKWRKKIYFFLFEKYIVEHTKCVHCIGESEQKVMNENYPSLKTVLIPNGQNRSDVKFVSTNIPKNNSPVFGFCGRIDIETKGLDLLFAAFKKFKETHNTKANFWVIGDGEEMIALTEMVKKLGITDSVTFWGEQFGNAKLNILSKIDVFFHPSRNEGLPGAVLEAAALGIPCVVSKESNMANYIDSYQAGVGLKKNTVQAIYEAMNNKEIVKLKDNAIRMIEEVFSWDMIVQKHLKVYAQ